MKVSWVAAAVLFLITSGHAVGEACKGPAGMEAGAHPDAGRLAALGGWFEQHNQSACAVEAYRAALKFDSRSTAALGGLAKELTATGDAEGAIALLRPAHREEELTLDLAVAYGKAGRLEEAAATLQEGLRATPAALRLLGALVTVRVNQGRFDDAAAVAQRALRLHPGDPVAQKLVLRVLILTNDTATARPMARRLLAGAPRDADFLYLNGVLERAAGDLALARGHLEQSLAINPDNEDARYNLGITLARLDDPRGARVQLERAIALRGEQPEAHLELSKVLQALGEGTEAQRQLAIYQEALKESTNRSIADSKSEEADAQMRAGDAGKAVALYRQAVEAEPRDAALLYKLSQALDRAGDTAGERTILEQTVESEPRLAVAQNQLGYLASLSGDAHGAEQHFQLAVAAAPGYTQAWISLAATLAIESRLPEARDALAKALRLEPRNAAALQLKKDLMAAHP